MTFIDDSNTEYERAVAFKGETLQGPMFAMNGFGDLSNEEFVARHSGGLPVENILIENRAEDSYLRTSEANQKLEKTSLGQTQFVPRIRNQGSCGSCWSFAAVLELENNYFRQTKTYVDLSQQELIDCEVHSNGCMGGYAESAYNYAAYFGLLRASEYPYVGAKGNCRSTYSEKRIRFTNMVHTNFTGFSPAIAKAASDRRVLASLFLKSDLKFRYLSNSDDIFDARLSGECNMASNHIVGMWYFDNGVITVINS